MHAKLAIVALAGLLAACSSPLTSVSPQPAAPGDAAALEPHVACPAVGNTFRRSNSSGKLIGVVATAGLPKHVFWTVTFTNQPYPPAAPVKFVPKLFKCGAPGSSPLGSVRDTGGNSTDIVCHNGVCKISITYDVTYTTPSKLPNGRPWKFDLIRFVPSPAKPPYGQLPGARIEVTR